MRLAACQILLMLAAVANAAPAPLPRREKLCPIGAVVLDFSPLVQPPPTDGGWEVHLSLIGSRDHPASYSHWTGSAGKDAARQLAGRIGQDLKVNCGNWLCVRDDPSGEKLILWSKVGEFRYLDLSLRGSLPVSRRPAVRPAFPVDFWRIR
jgi:hypothetical protein